MVYAPYVPTRCADRVELQLLLLDGFLQLEHVPVQGPQLRTASGAGAHFGTQQPNFTKSVINLTPPSTTCYLDPTLPYASDSLDPALERSTLAMYVHVVRVSFHRAWLEDLDPNRRLMKSPQNQSPEISKSWTGESQSALILYPHHEPLLEQLVDLGIGLQVVQDGRNLVRVHLVVGHQHLLRHLLRHCAEIDESVGRLVAHRG